MNRVDSTSPFGHKIRPRHRDRLAIVYVRQSTPQQVVTNRESTDLQYQLRQRAVALGWADDRVVVIDDDQGISGSSVTNRPGFQRLLAEVSLGHVGVVFGREMSRLARSCADWHQLLELCALFQVLLADADGLYDPADFNDRLLLGLKGTMSEAELHVLDTGEKRPIQRPIRPCISPASAQHMRAPPWRDFPAALVEHRRKSIKPRRGALCPCNVPRLAPPWHHVQLPHKPLAVSPVGGVGVLPSRLPIGSCSRRVCRVVDT